MGILIIALAALCADKSGNVWDDRAAAGMTRLSAAEKKIALFLILGRTPTDFRTSRWKAGDVSSTTAAIRVVQVIDKTTALIEFYDQSYLLVGSSTAGWADDRLYKMPQPFVISGTASFTTVLGAKRTLPTIIALGDEGLQVVENGRKALNYIELGTKTGGAESGSFLRSENGAAEIELADGSVKAIKLSELDTDSLEVVRKTISEMKSRAEKRK